MVRNTYKHNAMMNTTNILCLIVAAAVLYACGRNKQTEIKGLDVDVYTPEYASGFDIKGSGGQSTLLTVSNPWQGADSVKSQLLILRGGETAPDGFGGQVLRGNARRVVTTSSTHVAMLDAIGAVNTVVGVSGIDFITNPAIQRGRDTIADIGYDGHINYEALVAANPDVVLLYGVNGASSMEQKLRELGIPFVYIGDYVEESPLGKAEWLVALAEIVGRRNDGERYFAALPANYNALKQKVQQAGAVKPKVMFNTPYGDSWFMPSTQSYMVRLVNDAGGNYLYTKNTGNASMPIDLEEAYLLATQADCWLNAGGGGTRTLAQLKTMVPKFGGVKSVADGRVYNNNLRATAAGGNDFYESGIVHPDLVLRDLIKIFYPDQVKEDFVYYRKLE